MTGNTSKGKLSEEVKNFGTMYVLQSCSFPHKTMLISYLSTYTPELSFLKKKS